MNSMYTPERLFGRIGLKLAEDTIQSVAHLPSIKRRIEILEDCVVKAAAEMPRDIAEWIYDNADEMRPLSEPELAATLVRADTLRQPHRLSEIARKEYVEKLEVWFERAGDSTTDDNVSTIRENALFLLLSAIEYLLRTDEATSQIMANVTERQIEYARDTTWGGSIVREMDLNETKTGANESEDSDLNDDWWKLEFELRSELVKRKVPPTDFYHDGEVEILEKKVESLSMFEILHAAEAIYPRDTYLGMLIDSGMCEINASVYIQQLNRKIESLKAELLKDPSDTVEANEKKVLTVDQFIDLIFQSLVKHNLAGSCTRYDIATICERAKGGTLRLKIRDADVWCAHIADNIAYLIHRAKPTFTVYNGDKKLSPKQMHRAKTRPRGPGFSCPPNVTAFFRDLQNITVTIAQKSKVPPND
ncbi:MAG: hypothetical protein IPH85_12270 [Ignavibacteria bacterium]|nr:hypothetical protein [Ignavibacteria bacterium]MBK7186670.1 hypothetical protein [Ignavibacteria bacterium]MBK9182333.1 hypothetical protein [Ignavibacteria bacterium]